VALYNINRRSKIGFKHYFINNKEHKSNLFGWMDDIPTYIVGRKVGRARVAGKTSKRADNCVDTGGTGTNLSLIMYLLIAHFPKHSY